jgi:hypothetical protein
MNIRNIPKNYVHLFNNEQFHKFFVKPSWGYDEILGDESAKINPKNDTKFFCLLNLPHYKPPYADLGFSLPHFTTWLFSSENHIIPHSSN